MMAPTTWTARVAVMLRIELKALAVERAAVAIDGGLGCAAVETIAVLPPGPRRDFETAVWARRIIDGPGRLAFAIPPDASDELLQAFCDLHERILAELDGAA